MSSFAPWIRKEALEASRSYRLLVLGLAAAFFAFLDPLMLKLLPLIMKAQIGADLGSLFPRSRAFAFETFLGDLFEILGLIVCLGLGGILAKERKTGGFILPLSKGADFPGIVAAKALVYAAWLCLVLVPAVLASWLYAGLLFPETAPALNAGPGTGAPGALAAGLALPLRAAANYALYFAWLVSLVVLASAFFRSAVWASLTALALSFGLPALAPLLGIERLLPSFLATGSQKLALLSTASFLPSSLCAAACIVLFLAGSAFLMERAEL
jgi:ABC-2 type transport system permease protein